MQKRNSTYLFLLMLIGLGALSCSEDLNFSQSDDLTVEPTVASSIFYFESTEELVNLSTSTDFYTETFVFEAFSQDLIDDRILDGTITYQLENTTSKPMALEIAFLDDADTELDTETISIEAEPAPNTEVQVAYGLGGKSLEILRNTAQIQVSVVNLGDTTSTSTQQEPKIILRSSGAFRLKLL